MDVYGFRRKVEDPYVIPSYEYNAHHYDTLDYITDGYTQAYDRQLPGYNSYVDTG